MTPESSMTLIESNRRDFLKLAGSAGLGVAVLGGATLTIGCGKSISFFTSTVIGALSDLKPLLPNLSPAIDKAIAAGKAFDDAYRAGKFDNIDTLFENFGNTVNSFVAAIGVMNEDVKRYVLVGGIALRAIASLLKSQVSQSAVAAVVASKPRTSGMAMIERMADPVVLDKMMQLLMN